MVENKTLASALMAICARSSYAVRKSYYVVPIIWVLGAFLGSRSEFFQLKECCVIPPILYQYQTLASFHGGEVKLYAVSLFGALVAGVATINILRIASALFFLERIDLGVFKMVHERMNFKDGRSTISDRLYVMKWIGLGTAFFLVCTAGAFYPYSVADFPIVLRPLARISPEAVLLIRLILFVIGAAISGDCIILCVWFLVRGSKLGSGRTTEILP
jgi:hypothetical protein